MPEYNRLMQNMGYKFNDENLLFQALVHSSYANEKHRNLKSNERLEFLGDAVLEMISAVYLYHDFDGDEGELTKLRASIVCEKALCQYAKKAEISKYLLLGHGEMKNGGATRPSILADAFEAIIAAIYLDGGIDSARDFVLPFLRDEVENQGKPQFFDYKTLLQEIVQQNPCENVTYRLEGEHGPDHDKTFKVKVYLHSNAIGAGSGRSKKEAEQMAAKDALALLGHDDAGKR